MTRIGIASDLHIEFERHSTRPYHKRAAGHPVFGPRLDHLKGVDFMILAGDIDLGVEGIRYAQEVSQFLEAQVVYVAGNHEFYGSDYQRLSDALCSEAERTRGSVVLLENATVNLSGLTVAGCTLWTDYKIFDRPEQAMKEAMMLNDHRKISLNGHNFRPADALKLHRQSVKWLSGLFADGKVDHERTIVVTHHAPSMESCHEVYLGDPLTPAFISNLEEMILAHGPKLWVHGHTHHSIDYTIGKTRVVSSQRGYPDEPGAAAYEPIVIEI